MSNTNTGGPAFPRAPFEYIDNGNGLDWAVREQSGMTLRDYFAAQALPVVLKRWTEDAVKDGQPSILECDGAPTDLADLVAEEVYAMADAMLKARKA